MKKPTAILLALSLLANIALAFIVVRTGALSALVSGSQKTASAAQAQATPKPQASSDAIVAAVKNGDAQTLLALLKASGLDAKTAGFMSAGLELQKLADQAQALRPKGPYWRNNNFTPADRMKLQQLALDFGSRMQDLIPDLFAQAGAAKYDYLAPDRRAKLLALERDYNQLIAETRVNSSGFQLQSDTDKLKDIASERKREIDQFLTPDEIAARDMRESPAAQFLRNNYGAVIDTEADYQAAYAIMQAAGSDTDAGRAQVESLLGPDRMTKLAQMNDPDYALIQTAAARLQLIAPYTQWLRTFTTTGNGQPSVNHIAKTELSLHTLIGLWVSTDTTANAAQITGLAAILDAGPPPDLIAIGNETTLDNIPPALLLDMITQTRALLATRNLAATLPIGSVDIAGADWPPALLA